MSEVKRLHIEFRSGKSFEHPDGDWVEYDDHAVAMEAKDAEIERLRSKLNPEYFAISLMNGQGIFIPSIADSEEKAWGYAVDVFRHNDHQLHDQAVASRKKIGYRCVRVSVAISDDEDSMEPDA